jgi:hypothetical protein
MQLAVPAVAASVLVLTVAAIFMGVIHGGEAVAIGFVVLAALAGGVIAVIARMLPRLQDSPDDQRLFRHPGWYRFGAVGGVGGALARNSVLGRQ